jgi:hypothetical protein
MTDCCCEGRIGSERTGVSEFECGWTQLSSIDSQKILDSETWQRPVMQNVIKNFIPIKGVDGFAFSAVRKLK